MDKLLSFNPSEDPDRLLGQDRFICRQGSLLLVGETGIGKSSLNMKAALFWAAGRPFFGIESIRPLRVLIAQRENDEGDMAELLQGVFRASAFTDEERATILKNVTIVQETRRAGKDFAQWLEREITGTKSDLVIMDPLNAFHGGNISDNQEMGNFLCEELQPVLHRTGAAVVIVHHTGKPSKDVQCGAEMSDTSLKYFAIGASTVSNWVRAVMVLRPVNDDGIFELSIPKRGKRSGLKDSEGKPAARIFIKHSTSGISWDYAPEYEKAVRKGKNTVKRGRPPEHTPELLRTILKECQDKSGIIKNTKAFENIAKEEYGISRSSFFKLKPAAVSAGIIKEGPNGWEACATTTMITH